MSCASHGDCPGQIILDAEQVWHKAISVREFAAGFEVVQDWDDALIAEAI